MNSINGELARHLFEAVQLLDEDPQLSVGVLCGVGRGFCAGLDLKAFGQGEDLSPMLQFVRQGSKKPLIAAVEGFAFAGGLELALACDLIVAGEKARFGIPEVRVGLFAAGGGLIRLPSRIGYAKAMEMALTGDSVTAEEALRLGLVARLTVPGEALDDAVNLATRIGDSAPLAVAVSRSIVKAVPGRSEEQLWDLQKTSARLVLSSNDAKEGARAFAEKRAPNWTGS
jgi:enoyl-CoA hydratase